MTTVAASVPSDAVLGRLMALHPKAIDLTLGRVHRLLGALGNPEHGLPPVVHVTGTNGKGSVIAFMAAALEAAGYRVHVYSSPHLVRFHERIALAGVPIDDDDLAALLAECEAANRGLPITFFEITTVAAFLAFARTPGDVLLLENGLGGRLDATNVVARPALSVLTPISIDHVQFLGATVAEIAFEKAGILKAGVRAVIGPQVPEAMAVIARRAGEVGSPLIRFGREFTGALQGEGLVYRAGERTLGLPRPGLVGAWQTVNALVAVACLEALEGFAVTPAQIAAGLVEARWPARMQRLGRGPLCEALPVGWELWLDSGHNPGAGVLLAETLADWADRPLHLVCGMLNTKDSRGYLAPLAGVAEDVTCLAIPREPASRSAEDLAQAARAAGFARVTTAPDVAAALAAIVARGAGPARVLICGSIYLAGKVLAENG